MMYVEQYAQQRMNEQQAERENEWRRIAAHWNQDARTVPASKWAVVRLIDRVFGRHGVAEYTLVPDGARVPDPATGKTSSSDAPATPVADGDSVWPEGSAAGRFAEGVDAAGEASHDAGEGAQRELAVTR